MRLLARRPIFFFHIHIHDVLDALLIMLFLVIEASLLCLPYLYHVYGVQKFINIG